MKRRISFVIAFALSFLMMFGSIARADEIKVPISVSTSESNNLEIIIKVPSTQTNKLGAKTNEIDCSSQANCGECESSDGGSGYWKTGEDGSPICETCFRAMCGACSPLNNPTACGRWQGGVCITCGTCGKKL